MTSSTPDSNQTTLDYINVEAPAEPLGALPDPFLLPPLGSGRAYPDSASLRREIVNTIQPYSMDVKVDAIREMILKLEKRYL